MVEFYDHPIHHAGICWMRPPFLSAIYIPNTTSVSPFDSPILYSLPDFNFCSYPPSFSLDWHLIALLSEAGPF